MAYVNSKLVLRALEMKLLQSKHYQRLVCDTLDSQPSMQLLDRHSHTRYIMFNQNGNLHSHERVFGVKRIKRNISSVESQQSS